MRLLCHRGATRGFAEAALALLRRKFERHHAGEDFEAFVAASGGEENPRTKRVEALHALFACPEGILVAQLPVLVVQSVTRYQDVPMYIRQ